jgi:DNA-binding IscR family transcriptional regulator
MLSTAQKVYVIASRQRRGDVSKTASNTGFSPSYVSRVFRGLRNNESILSEGYRIASRRMKNVDPNA